VFGNHKMIALIDHSEVMRKALDQPLVSSGLQTELYGLAKAFVEATMKSQGARLVNIQRGGITGSIVKW
jgi:FixJ family two-component response regulator